ncbi:MAG: LON peptidase substrate-binding domain-containing protein, partial [bacterium]
MSGDSIMAGDGFREIPEIMPAIPLTGTILYPFMVVPFFVQGPRNEKALDTAVAGDHYIFAATLKQPAEGEDEQEPLPENFNAVGTVASVLRLMRVPTGGVKVMVQGLFRGRASSITVHADGYVSADVELLEDIPVELTPSVEALMRTVRDQLERAAKLGKSLPQEFIAMVRNLKEPGKLADLASSTAEMEAGDAQTILEQLDQEKRLAFVSRILSRELEILEIQSKIKSNVQSEIEESQRKYFLKEQLKAIQKELGLEDPHSSEVNELRKSVIDAAMPDAARKQALNEVDRLARMHPDAAEAGVIRTYIDWMLALPWTKSTADRLDLDLARKTLDEDHFGLDKIKERIVETLAVRKLNPTARSPIICFVGPPGVGKTSLGQSIARALDRKFVRLSVGGVRDEAEIRGHRR